MKIAEKASGGKSFDLKGVARYACDRIKTVIETVGPRAPGSPEELKSQEMMAEELKQWSDSVEIEPFTVHRQAFMGFIPFTVLMAVASTFLYWFGYPVVGFILCVLGLIPLVLEFVMYRQFIDPLFPGHESHNVVAKRAPKGEVKQRIVLVGHADSQYEWTLNYLLGGTGMKAVLIPAVVGLLISTIACLVKFLVFDVGGVQADAAQLVFKIIGIVLFCFVPFFVMFLLFQNPFKSVPGANDNLTGCYVAMGVLKALDDADVRFENTEVVALLSGSEEAGLRGAKAYAKRHRQEMLDVDTVSIALDTFRDLDYLAIYDRDLSGTLQHNMQAKELVRRAGENCGLKLSYESVYLGASDAAAFTQEGIKATAFAAMDPTPPRYYHTRLDNWDILNPDAIQTGLEVVLEATCMYDAQGLEP